MDYEQAKNRAFYDMVYDRTSQAVVKRGKEYLVIPVKLLSAPDIVLARYDIVDQVNDGSTSRTG